MRAFVVRCALFTPRRSGAEARRRRGCRPNLNWSRTSRARHPLHQGLAGQDVDGAPHGTDGEPRLGGQHGPGRQVRDDLPGEDPAGTISQCCGSCASWSMSPRVRGTPAGDVVGRLPECRAELTPRQGRSRAMRIGARGRLWAVTAPSEGSDRQRPPTAFMQVSPDLRGTAAGQETGGGTSPTTTTLWPLTSADARNDGPVLLLLTC
jgi:hypothetical protein